MLTRLLEAVFITRPLAQRGKKDDGKLLVMAGPEVNRFFSKNDKDHFRSLEFWMRFVEQFDAKATHINLTMSGEAHLRTRRIKRPGYSRGVGEAQVSGIVDVTRQEIALWSHGKPIIGTPMSHRLVYNLMCHVMAGISAPEYFEDFMALFEASFKAILGLYPGRLRWSRLRRARERLDELTARIIALHEPENRGDRPPDVIDHMLALHRSDPQFLPETDLGNHDSGTDFCPPRYDGPQHRVHVLRTAQRPRLAAPSPGRGRRPLCARNADGARRSSNSTSSSAPTWRRCACIPWSLAPCER